MGGADGRSTGEGAAAETAKTSGQLVRVGALDLGTNTFLLLVADVRDGRVERVVRDEATVVRLGQVVDGERRLHPDALRRADECLERFSAIARKAGAELLLGCATSAARDASNREELLEVGRKRGVEIRVISGPKEAELTYLGTVGESASRGPLVIDVGGGSTEAIVGEPGPGASIAFRESVDAGSVRLTERAFSRHPIPDGELQAAVAWTRERFAPLATGLRARLDPLEGRPALAVAGTATTLAALDLGRPFDADSVDGHEMTVARVDEWARRLARMSVAERQALSGMDAGRADVIVAGAICLAEAARATGIERFRVSVRGLRYGVAARHEELRG